MFVPERILTNEELAQQIDTTDEWIRERSGIRERHIAGENDTTSTMSTAAARAALGRAGVSPEDVELIIVATSSPDYITPPVSSQIQAQLGATRAGAFTVVVGCTGFVTGLVTAEQFIKTGAYRTILVIGAELISRNLDWTDRTTCVLFGDGAGAIVMQASETPCGISAFEFGSDGDSFDAIIQWSTGVVEPPTVQRIEEGRHYLRMNGREVFRFATTTMGASLMRALKKAEMSPEDIDLLIPHQANARIIEYAVKQIGLPPEKVVVNVERYGNTSAASIPIALYEALEAGRAKPGDTVAFVGFGAGLTWATAILTLSPDVPLPTGSERSRDSVIAEDGTVIGNIA